ncbi:MAG: MBL fold metallo-hydrolase [Acidobacteria bacterium]|nr:MBL fold metallo-hydrolase [Acidobacteriota bacterium]
MRQITRLLLPLLAGSLLWAARDLEIHFIDVEGGQATLIKTPAGESLLVDAGWPGFDGRDAKRIAETARQAGLRQIDYMLNTHYHLDHVGGIPPLTEHIPIVTFVDHGPNTEQGKNAEALSAAYEKVLAKGKHLVVKPGDRIPLKGVEVIVITARGERIARPLKGAGAANPHCEGVPPKAEDKTENGRSVGFLLTYGKFRFLNLADLTWNNELALMCPANPIGTVDVYLINHHGMNISNAPPLVYGVRPRVAVLLNGAKKGGAPDTYQWIRKSPGLEDIWQLHFSLAAGAEGNAPEQFIANPEAQCQGRPLKLVAASGGSFTVTNARNNLTKSYSARR